MSKKGPLKVEYYLKRELPKLSPSDKLTYAREVMREGGYRVLPVSNPGNYNRLEGLLYRSGVLLTTSTRSELTVREVMAPPIVILLPDDDMREAVKKMLKADEWYAPVISMGNEFLGMFGLESVIEYYYWNEPDLLHRVKTKDIMGGKDRLVYVEPEESVTRLWYLMVEHKYAGIPVLKNGKVVGIVTQHDLLVHGIGRPELESESNPRRTKVKEVMRTPVYTVRPEDPVILAARLMIEKNIGRVVVADDRGKPIGIVDREDVVKILVFT